MQESRVALDLRRTLDIEEGTKTQMTTGNNSKSGRVASGRKLTLGVLALATVGGTAWVWHGYMTAAKADARPRGLYTTAGYGGYLTPQPLSGKGIQGQPQAAQAEAKAAEKASDPVAAVRDAYNAGKYRAAEALAAAVAKANGQSANASERKAAVQAEMVAAYAAARRNDFGTARERFAQVRQEAEALPDRGAARPTWGEITPTLEEEAAFQHAVCTGKVAGPGKAEEEYRAFLGSEPQSVLVHAATKRIARLHGGDLPKDAEALWKKAMKTQATIARAERRAQSLCGPEVVAELLRRRGKSVAVETLARAMHTDENGTTLQHLTEGAQSFGLHLRGEMRTGEGLQKAKLPLVALVVPGHFVIVEKVGADGVTAWNPDKNGLGKAGREVHSPVEWAQRWNGVTLTP